MNKLINLIITLTLIFCVSNAAQAAFDQYTGLVAQWKFNGNANDTNGVHNGTVTNATLTSDRFNGTNSAYYFDGDGDLITVPDHDDLDITGNITISSWVKVEQSSYSGSGIVDKWDNVNMVGYTTRISDPSNCYYQAYLVNSSENSSAYVSVNLCDGNWHHVLTTYDGTTMYLYLDGILKSTTSHSNGTGSNSIDLSIGRTRGWGSSDDRWFKGSIDDVRIYNRYLSECDVQALYILERNTAQ